MDSGLQLLGSRSFPVELEFRIPIVLKGFRIRTAVLRIQRPRIPDSTSKNFQDPGFHKKKKIPRSRIRHAKIYWIPESALLYMAMGRRDPHDTGRIYDRFKIHVDTEPP